MGIVRKVIEISGRVQGVGYRYFVRDSAEALGLTGWVRNSPMRTVEIEVQGKDEDVKAFCEKLREGPPLARVKGLKISEMSILSNEPDFDITH
jgi:Acylphosphatases